MIVSHIVLKNWRNFQSVDVELGDRVFLVGANASGKSNFLDAFRFLRDICMDGGGLQSALSQRGGLSKIRCLAARSSPNVELEVQLSDSPNDKALWKYSIGIKQEPRGYRDVLISHETVYKGDTKILERPDSEDEKDKYRLKQTHLEQISANQQFRNIATYFRSVSYLHLIPQLVRHAGAFAGPGIPGDPFGQDFLNRIAQTTKKTRDSRLKKIQETLKNAVPHFEELAFIKDDTGIPHIETKYRHWRPYGARQREDQFSDGTLRLIALLWSLLESDSLLLLEEPELSLNIGIVSKLAQMFHRIQRKKKRQIILSTHSADLLSDKGIGCEEVLLLQPTAEGTEVTLMSSRKEAKALLEGGLSVGDIASSYTTPANIEQLELFE